MAPHWTRPPVPAAVDRGRLLVADLGDDSAATLAHLARRCGWRPTVRAVTALRDTDLRAADLHDTAHRPDDPDLTSPRSGTSPAHGAGGRAPDGLGVTRPAGTVLLGPGPGHPDDPGSEGVRRFVREALRAGCEVRGVELGFQVLARVLGLPVVPRRTAGGPRVVEVFGVRSTLVLRNRFAVTGPVPAGVETWLDEATGEVLALRAPQVAGVQFRPEAILAKGGADVLDALLRPPPA
ncbi:hypothetical protein CKY47_05850 [Saccharothrix yanglingensis]|uniref:Glutamine amidotransferase domain-containing protein n=2 Tax=Saccharothrix yanglingensis TaxID=659496 RepID=A0ABU0WUI4_9PSEU|nr:hypothetical protein [Saccharothrix yanglingensis]